MDTNKKALINKYKERKISGGVYAIRNTKTGKMLLLAETDLPVRKNRFYFSQKIGSSVNMILQQEWAKWGGDVFEFEVLEEIDKEETQTDKEFKEDLKLLLELWKEKYSQEILY